MKRILLLASVSMLCMGLIAQNVFSPTDPTVRYDVTKLKGTPQNPDTAKRGLQKFVSTPTNGVSTGSDVWDASSLKAYFLNNNGTKLAFRIKFPKSYSNVDSVNKI